MKRTGLRSLFVFTALTFAAVVYTVVAGNQPLLGLDLQGGVSVVLQPVGDPPSESVEQAQEIIRNRVDAIGVAEPDIVRQGETIVVQLPGVEDREEALELIGRTAKLDFRPVISETPIEAPPGESTPAPEAPGAPPGAPGAPPGSEPAPTPAPLPGTSTDPNVTTPAPAPAPAPADGTPPPAVPSSSATDQQSSGVPAGEGEVALGAQDPTTPPASEPPPSEPPAPSVPTTPSVPGDLGVPPVPGTAGPTTPTDALPCTEAAPTEPCTAESSPDSEVRARYVLGPQPAGGTPGEAVASAQAQLGNGTWAVGVTIKDEFKARINELFNTCFAGGQGCAPLRASESGQPAGAVAIVLDGQVVSAPTVNSQNLADQEFQITGDFTQGEAEDLALVLRYGALPVEFQDDVNVQEVSATVGEDSLRAGVIAGIVGLALVAAYMIGFYRLLGAVAIASLVMATALLWVVICYLGETQGLALTLAGITGIIVSVGVAVDSNVVVYENLKEDLARGRSLRSTVNASFDTAWHTILSADLATLIGAVLLYVLTVGSVRGFALFLGIASIIDLLASYFFMRPLVLWLGRNDRFQDRLGLLGAQPPSKRSDDAPAPDDRPSSEQPTPVPAVPARTST